MSYPLVGWLIRVLFRFIPSRVGNTLARWSFTQIGNQAYTAPAGATRCYSPGRSTAEMPERHVGLPGNRIGGPHRPLLIPFLLA